MLEKDQTFSWFLRSQLYTTERYNITLYSIDNLFINDSEIDPECVSLCVCVCFVQCSVIYFNCLYLQYNNFNLHKVVYQSTLVSVRFRDKRANQRVQFVCLAYLLSM
jgi:hypothetical protein